MSPAIAISIILVMRVVQNYFGKRTSQYFPSTSMGRIKYLAIAQGIAALFALITALISRSGTVSVTMLLISAASGACLAVSSVCGNLAKQSGTMALSSVFSAAGLILPAICGSLFFGEPMSWLKWIGVAGFICCSVLLVNASREICRNLSLKTMAYLIGCLLANGGTMLCQKLLTYAAPGSNIALFSFFTFAIPAVVCAGWMAVLSRKQSEPLDAHLRLPILLLAAAVFVINQLATTATGQIPSVILFALINGGNTIIAALVAAVCFHERLTVKSVLGILLCVTALILTNAG